MNDYMIFTNDILSNRSELYKFELICENKIVKKNVKIIRQKQLFSNNTENACLHKSMKQVEKISIKELSSRYLYHFPQRHCFNANANENITEITIDNVNSIPSLPSLRANRVETNTQAPILFKFANNIKRRVRQSSRRVKMINMLYVNFIHLFPLSLFLAIIGGHSEIFKDEQLSEVKVINLYHERRVMDLPDNMYDEIMGISDIRIYRIVEYVNVLIAMKLI
ncbi:hypothetical protein RFI_31663, partial [Reticulomyxa filosa]